MMKHELDVVVAQGRQESRPFERKAMDAHIIPLGHILFAIGLMGLGVLSLGSGDFAYTWQPVPQWVIWRASLARLSGLLLCATGIVLLIRPAVHYSAILVSLYLALVMFALHLPYVLFRLTDVGRWLGPGESLTLVCGGWILVLAFSRHDSVTPVALWNNLGFHNSCTPVHVLCSESRTSFMPMRLLVWSLPGFRSESALLT